jgi:hypothetical protein
LPPIHPGARPHFLPNLFEDDLRIYLGLAGRAVDVEDDVLEYGWRRPEKFTRRPVERVHHTRLSGNARNHLPLLPGTQPRVDPAHRALLGGHGGIDQQPLERVVEIPVIDHVLVVPHDLAGIGVQRQRAIVIEVLEIFAAQHELGSR